MEKVPFQVCWDLLNEKVETLHATQNQFLFLPGDKITNLT